MSVDPKAVSFTVFNFLAVNFLSRNFYSSLSTSCQLTSTLVVRFI